MSIFVSTVWRTKILWAWFPDALCSLLSSMWWVSQNDICLAVELTVYPCFPTAPFAFFVDCIVNFKCTKVTSLCSVLKDGARHTASFHFSPTIEMEMYSHKMCHFPKQGLFCSCDKRQNTNWWKAFIVAFYCIWFFIVVVFCVLLPHILPLILIVTKNARNIMFLYIKKGCLAVIFPCIMWWKLLCFYTAVLIIYFWTIYSLIIIQCTVRLLSEWSLTHFFPQGSSSLAAS